MEYFSDTEIIVLKVTTTENPSTEFRLNNYLYVETNLDTQRRVNSDDSSLMFYQCSSKLSKKLRVITRTGIYSPNKSVYGIAVCQNVIGIGSLTCSHPTSETQNLATLDLTGN